jgi:hypothetical protein
VNDVQEAPKMEVQEEQHSSKTIKKDNKMKRLQNKEFGEGKGHEVQEINDNNEVMYKSRLRPRNDIRDKPKIGFEVGDKIKSEFIENGSKKWYSGEIIKVNPATYKVTFSDGEILNMKKAEVFADDSARAVTTPDNQVKIQEVEPEAKTKKKSQTNQKF